MRKFFLLICLVLVGFTLFKYFTNSPPLPLNNAKPTIQIKDAVYTVEIADTDTKRTQGLSGKKGLESNAGMLFLFDKKDTYAFWMKDMLFPIDIIWIDDDTIADISENVPIPLTATYLPKYGPKVPINRVLEVNAGEVKKNHIQIGDKVVLTLIKEEIKTGE